MQYSHWHLRSIQYQLYSYKTRLFEKRELCGYLIPSQHLLPWHSICPMKPKPHMASCRSRKKEERGEGGVYLISKSCTSYFITIILWLKTMRHKKISDFWETISSALFLTWVSSWDCKALEFVREKWAGYAACHWYVMLSLFSKRYNFHLRESQKGGGGRLVWNQERFELVHSGFHYSPLDKWMHFESLKLGRNPAIAGRAGIKATRTE